MDNQAVRSSRSLVSMIGIALLLLGLLSLLLLPVPAPTFLWKAVNNFGHVPLFGLVAILLLGLSRMLHASSGWPNIRHYGIALLGVLVLALLTEALQSLNVSRQASSSDVFHDLLGAICGLGLFLTYDTHLSGGWVQWRAFPRNVFLRLSVVLVLGVTLFPIFEWAYAYWDRGNRFPSILQFSSDWEVRFVKTLGSELQVVVPPLAWKKLTGDMVGQVVFQTKKYPRIRIEEPHPNWEGYSHFQLDIFSELPTRQPIVIQIADQYPQNGYSGEFKKTLTIFPGLNEIQISLDEIRLGLVGREIDLSTIKGIMLFARNPSEEFRLYLDNIHLE